MSIFSILFPKLKLPKSNEPEQKLLDREAHAEDVAVGITNPSLSDSLSFAYANPNSERFDLYIKAYVANPTVYHAVSTIAKLCATEEVKINSQALGKQYQNVAENLVSMANNQETIYDLIYKIVVLRRLFGFAIMVKEKVGANVYWTVLNPKYCQVVVDPDTKIRAVKYSINSQDYYFLDEDMIVFEEFNPANFYYGTSSIEAADLDLQANQYSKRATAQQYKLGDPPNVALGVVNVSKDEEKKLKKEFLRRTPESGKQLIYDKQHFEITDLSVRGGKNITGVDVAKASSENIALSLGFPPQLLSDTTKEPTQLLKYLYVTAIIPELRYIERKLTHYFKVHYTQPVIFKFSLLKNPIIASVFLDTAKNGASMVSQGLITVNEFRQMFLGAEEFETFSVTDLEGDTYSVEFGNLPRPVFDLAYRPENSQDEDAGQQAENGTLPGSEGGRNQTDS